MTPEEFRLAKLIRELTPHPERAIEPGDIVAFNNETPSGPLGGRSRASLIAAAVGAAVVVAGVSVGITQLTSGSSSRPRARPAETAPSSPPSTARSGKPIGLWDARVVSRQPVQVGSLVSAAGVAYGLTSDSLVRIDPASDNATASTAVDAQTSAAPVYADNAVWVAVAQSPMATMITKYDPTTLKPLGSLKVTSSGQVGSSSNAPTLIADPSEDQLMLARGDSVSVIDARAVTVKTTMHVDGGAAVAISLSPNDRALYLGVLGTSSSQVRTLDPSSGDVLDKTPLTDTLRQGLNALVATNGGVWVATGSGMETRFAFMPQSGQPPADSGAGDAGGGEAATVTIAGDLAWIAGPDKIACADLSTGRALAVANAPTSGFLTDVIRLGSAWYARFQSQTDGSSEVVTFQPPPACGT